MITCVTTDRGRLEAIEEYCDACGALEAARRGWPRRNGSVALGRGWRETVTYRPGTHPAACQACEAQACAGVAC